MTSSRRYLFWEKFKEDAYSIALNNQIKKGAFPYEWDVRFDRFSVGLLSRTIDLLNVSRRESFRNTLTFAFLFLFFI